MKSLFITLLIVSSSVHAAKLKDFDGSWTVTGNCKFYNSVLMPDQRHYEQSAIGTLEITTDAVKSSMQIDGGYPWFVEIQNIKNINKGKQVKTTKDCGNNPLGLNQCVIIKDIQHAKLSGSTLSYSDILKESWVRPFYSSNGPTFKLSLNGAKNMLTLLKEESDLLPRTKFTITCQLKKN